MCNLVGGSMEEKYKQMIKETIKKVVHIEADDNVNLCSTLYGIPAYLFLYIICDLEEQTHIPISKIIGTNTYEIFSVSGLAKEMVCYQNNLNNGV